MRKAKGISSDWWCLSLHTILPRERDPQYCLLEDKGLYNKCVEEGARLVQRYNWESIAKKTERVYEWAIKQHYRLKS